MMKYTLLVLGWCRHAERLSRQRIVSGCFPEEQGPTVDQWDCGGRGGGKNNVGKSFLFQ